MRRSFTIANVFGFSAFILALGHIEIASGDRLDKQALELKQIVVTKRVKNGLLVDFSNELLFEPGSAGIKLDAIPQLTQIGRILARHRPDRIRITGHTDSHGKEESNERLSVWRANAVRDLFTELGVDGNRIETFGHGKTKPVESNNTRKGRAMNRRVELFIETTGESVGG